MPETSAADAAPPVQERLAAIDNAVLINVLTKAKEGKSVTATDWREARRIAHELGLGGSPTPPHPVKALAAAPVATLSRQPAAQFPWDSISDLAEALGVHRNSVTNWAKEGAPAGPPYCELQWRTWAAANGKKVPKPPEQRLLDLLARAGLPEYRRMAEQQQRPAAGDQPAGSTGADSAVQGVIDWDNAKKKADAELKQMELARLKKLLVPVEDVHRLVEALGILGAEIFDDHNAMLDGLALGADDLTRVRVHLTDRLHARRSALVTGLADRLRQMLERQ